MKKYIIYFFIFFIFIQREVNVFADIDSSLQLYKDQITKFQENESSNLNMLNNNYNNNMNNINNNYNIELSSLKDEQQSDLNDLKNKLLLKESVLQSDIDSINNHQLIRVAIPDLNGDPNLFKDGLRFVQYDNNWISQPGIPDNTNIVDEIGNLPVELSRGFIYYRGLNDNSEKLDLSNLTNDQLLTINKYALLLINNLRTHIIDNVNPYIRKEISLTDQMFDDAIPYMNNIRKENYMGYEHTQDVLAKINKNNIIDQLTTRYGGWGENMGIVNGTTMLQTLTSLYNVIVSMTYGEAAGYNGNVTRGGHLSNFTADQYTQMAVTIVPNYKNFSSTVEGEPYSNIILFELADNYQKNILYPENDTVIPNNILSELHSKSDLSRISSLSKELNNLKEKDKSQIDKLIESQKNEINKLEDNYNTTRNLITNQYNQQVSSLKNTTNINISSILSAAKNYIIQGLESYKVSLINQLNNNSKINNSMKEDATNKLSERLNLSIKDINNSNNINSLISIYENAKSDMMTTIDNLESGLNKTSDNNIKNLSEKDNYLGISLYPPSLSFIGEINNNNNLTLNGYNKDNLYNVEVNDTLKIAKHWKLTANFNWENNELPGSQIVFANADGLVKQKITNGMASQKSVIGKKNIILKSGQGSTYIMYKDNNTMGEGKYDYDLGQPTLVIPNSPSIEAKTYSGNIDWNLALTP